MTSEAAPPRPDPWATTAPWEALRDNNAGRIQSLTPAACLDQVGVCAVPTFANLVDFCGHDEGYAQSVRFTSQKAMVFRSRTQHVHGGGSGGECEPYDHPDQVRAEGSPVMRHGDRFWMDNRQTLGAATFKVDDATYAPPIDRDPMPGSMRQTNGSSTGTGLWARQISDHDGTRVLSDASPKPPIPGQRYAQLAEPLDRELEEPPPPPPPPPLRTAPTQAPPSQPLPPSLVPAPYPSLQPRISPFQLDDAPPPPVDPNASFFRDHRDDWNSGEYGAYTTNLPYPLNRVVYLGPRDGRFILGDDLATADDVERLYQAQLKDQREQTRKRQNARISRKPEPGQEAPCLIGRYEAILDACTAAGGETHHIIPDAVYRLGPRPETAAAMRSTDERIPNAPTFNDGQSICLTEGQHRTDDDAIHRSLNPAISVAGHYILTPSRTGTAELGAILPHVNDAIDAIRNISQECKRKAIRAASVQSLPMMGQPVRTTMYALPTPGAQIILRRGYY